MAMVYLSQPAFSASEPCPYLSGRQMRLEYFFADGVSGEELDELLCAGWRTFGRYFFRPACESCRECIPVRIPVALLKLSDSQRKVRNRCTRAVQVWFGPLRCTEEVFDVYHDHSANRFGKKADKGEFLLGFFCVSCPVVQSEYRVDGDLAGVGFLNQSSAALSSAYFVWRGKFGKLGLGIYSVIAECQRVAELGLKYYYLGYVVSGNHSMNYKGRFIPSERYDWVTGRWEIAAIPAAMANAKGNGAEAVAAIGGMDL